jgi:hypothetical protein
MKGTALDVYSVFAQFILVILSKDDPTVKKPVLISLGNSNANGI